MIDDAYIDFFSQAHDRAWSEAEQAATEYGKAVAESTSTVTAPTAQMLRYYNFSQLFRYIMRERRKIISSIRK